MNHGKLFVPLLLTLALFTVPGCLRPKRADDTAHSYVLSSTAVRSSQSAPVPRDLRVGVAPVEVPSYLLDRRIVQRKGSSEVRYLENHRWAERLDKGIQRVLGSDLAILLDTDRVALSSWARQAVQAELYVAIQRFDYEENGQVLLEARWRIASPGGESTLLTGRSHITRTVPGGPAQAVDAAVTQLSQAMAEMSHEIAAALPGALTSAKGSSAPGP